jgi:NADPH-dependent ferric siderophore reductase
MLTGVLERGADRRHARVVAVVMPTPSTVRLVAAGELSDWPEPGPAAYVDLYLPDTPVGPVVRPYTVADWDGERGHVTIDMALHSGLGPATQWASRVVPGMWLEVGRFRTTFTSLDARSYLFAGDETALPAIATCLAALPPSARATALIEVADASGQRPLASCVQLDIRWRHRVDPLPDLAQVIRDVAGSDRPEHVWLAGEGGCVERARRLLLDGGSPAAMLQTWAFWRDGQVSAPGSEFMR